MKVAPGWLPPVSPTYDFGYQRGRVGCKAGRPHNCRCLRLVDNTAFADVGDARALAQAIVDTVREPLLVLDGDLHVVAASRSYYRTFQVSREDTQGRFLYSLGAGQRDSAALRLLLGRIVPDGSVMEGYGVERDFPRLGRRIMLLNARKVSYDGNSQTTLLLAIEDITDRHTAVREAKAVQQEHQVLLQEMQRRVNNSLQIIATSARLRPQGRQLLQHTKRLCRD